MRATKFYVEKNVFSELEKLGYNYSITIDNRISVVKDETKKFGFLYVDKDSKKTFFKIYSDNHDEFSSDLESIANECLELNLNSEIPIAIQQYERIVRVNFYELMNTANKTELAGKELRRYC